MDNISIKNVSDVLLKSVKCLIVNKDTVKTFNNDNRIEVLKTGNIEKDDFKKAFLLSRMNEPIDNILLKWYPYQKLDDGTQTFKSETITPEMHVIGHDDVNNDAGEERLLCKVNPFTINDKLVYNDKLYMYTEEKDFKPFIDQALFNSTTIHDGVINFGIRVVYNYDEQVKMRIKLNDGEYSEYGKECYPYDIIPGTIDSKKLHVGKNTVTIEISNMDETKKSEKQLVDAITLDNNSPTCKILDADSSSYKVHFLIEDKDLKDEISYQISIINTKCKQKVLVPWTEAHAQPLNISYAFDSSNIVVDEDNTILIEFKDNFNEKKTATYSFTGKYNNIVFMDENGEYYSTDTGRILKILDFENLIAGATSNEAKIIIKNTSAVPVTNLNISILYLTQTDGVKIELSKNTNPFNSMNTLDYGKEILNPGTSKEFFVRMSSNVKSYGFNKFQIVAKSTVVK